VDTVGIMSSDLPFVSPLNSETCTATWFPPVTLWSGWASCQTWPGGSRAYGLALNGQHQDRESRQGVAAIPLRRPANDAL